MAEGPVVNTSPEVIADLERKIENLQLAEANAAAGKYSAELSIAALSTELETVKGERDALLNGLSAIIHCQSHLSRSEMREAAADLLDEAGLRPKWLGGDQSPFVQRALAAEAKLAGGEAVAQFLPTEDGEFNGNVADIVPDGCTGSSLVFSEGILHVNKDGSGHIVVKEADFQIETEHDDDGARSDFWITRFPSGEMQALKDFLNGVPLTHPAPTHNDAGSGEVTASEPAMIIEGIRQFGLAADGSDLRDLEAALSHTSGEVTEAMVEAACRAYIVAARDRTPVLRGCNSSDMRAALEAALRGEES